MSDPCALDFWCELSWRSAVSPIWTVSPVPVQTFVFPGAILLVICGSISYFLLLGLGGGEGTRWVEG